MAQKSDSSLLENDVLEVLDQCAKCFSVTVNNHFCFFFSFNFIELHNKMNEDKTYQRQVQGNVECYDDLILSLLAIMMLFVIILFYSYLVQVFNT